MRDAYIAAFGRFLIAVLFLGAGLSKLGDAGSTTAYIASTGLPFPGIVYALTVLVEVGGGLILLVGFQARFASLALAVFTILAALLFHNDFADQNQMIHFMKNFAIAGGLLQITGLGAGRFSLDARRAARAAVKDS